MKRIVHTLPWLGMVKTGLVLLLLGWAQAMSAQATGSQAQAADEATSQTQETAPAAKRLRHSPTTSATDLLLQLRATQPPADPAIRLWERPMPLSVHPTRPHRPIPVVLVVLGLLMMLLWSLLLIGALVSSGGAVLAFVLLALLFSPIFVIGMIFFIGGLIAGLSGNRKNRPLPSAS
jgi:hypothetical protein